MTVALAILAISGCAAAPDDAPLRESGVAATGGAYERGKQHLIGGRIGLAVKELHAALEQAPESVPVLNALAAAYDRLGRFDLSARYYGRALAREPGAPQTLNNICYSYLLQGQSALALAYLSEAHDRDPAEPVARGNRERARLALHRRPAPALAQAGQAAISAAAAQGPWIERTDAMTQSLVTRPAPHLATALARARTDPRLVAFRAPPADGLDAQPIAAPMPVPGLALGWWPGDDRHDQGG